MKSIWASALLMLMLQPAYKMRPKLQLAEAKTPRSHNLFIITIDGFRWQELFAGADAAIINNEKFNPDTATTKLLYWDASAIERRKKLLPFFWNVIAAKGQLYGNRSYGNRVDVANLFSLSYLGYNEMFTGTTDTRISSNKKRLNPNVNVLEHLNSKPAFNGKVALFSSWDVFPYILNTERNNLIFNSGYANMEAYSVQQELINIVQTEAVYNKGATRHDELTFLTAKEYIKEHRPRVVCIGLGETDEFAHKGRYDLYLQRAAQADRMIGELWSWVQTDADYKDNTTFIITTDHGRGSKPSKWASHGEFIGGSSQVWIAAIGPALLPIGEVKEKQQQYLQQVAQTIARIVGEDFSIAENDPLSIR